MCDWIRVEMEDGVICVVMADLDSEDSDGDMEWEILCYPPTMEDANRIVDDIKKWQEKR